MLDTRSKGYELIEKEQKKASQSAADKLAAAQQEEQQVAADLAKVDDQRKLPEAVVSRYDFLASTKKP